MVVADQPVVGANKPVLELTDQTWREGSYFAIHAN